MTDQELFIAREANGMSVELEPTRGAVTGEDWKFAYTTRRVDRDAVGSVVGDAHQVPKAGDLVLAEVLELGQHKRLELVDGRRAALFPGDRIVVCYGNRYAPDQFEGHVPGSLEPCHLTAAGGVAAQVKRRHASMAEATRIAPIGLLHDTAGRHMNVADYSLGPPPPSVRPAPTTIAVVGTSMNSGKTTTVASLVRGLRASGLRVGAAKVTGTGAGGDVWLMKDAGAEVAYDFTDAGAATTSLLPLTRLVEIVDTLVGHLAAAAADAVVFEVADGLLQPETAALVASDEFAATVDAIVFAAGEAMGAVAGVRWLLEHGLPVAAVSGAVTLAPLAAREVGAALDLPVRTSDELARPEVATELARSSVVSLAA